MALPETGLTIEKIRQALGAATNDLGRLCIHPNVNKWSKYKPNYNADREHYSFFEDGEGHWDYIPPTGGENHPYRQGDFRGYDHSAAKPVLLSVPDVVNVQNSTMFFNTSYFLPRLIYNQLPYIDGKEYILVTDKIMYPTYLPHYIYGYAKLSDAASTYVDISLCFKNLPLYNDTEVNYDIHYGVWRLIATEPNPRLDDIENYQFLYEIGNGTPSDGSVKNILFKGTQQRPVETVLMDIYIAPESEGIATFMYPYYEIIDRSTIKIKISDFAVNARIKLGMLYNPDDHGTFEDIVTINAGYYPDYEILSFRPPINGWSYFEIRQA